MGGARAAGRRLRVGLFGLAALAVACGSRPTVEVRRPESPPQAVLVRDVAVLDVEAGRRVPGRDVLLRAGLIEAVEPTGEIAPPEDARVIAGTGATLVPGLVDMHGHVEGDSAPSWSSRFPDPEANLRGYLYAGVTTVFDPGASPAAFGRRDAVARGEPVGPHLVTAGRILTAPGGHPLALVEALAPWWLGWYVAGQVAVAVPDAASAHAEVESQVEAGADAIKVVVDRIPLDGPRMAPEVIAAVVERAHALGLPVVAHVGTTRDALDAAAAGVDLQVHAVYKERMSDEDVAAFAEHGVPVVATLEVFDAYARLGQGPRRPSRLEREMVPGALLAAFHPVPQSFDPGPLASWLEHNREVRGAGHENVRRLHAAGVTLLAGSDTQAGVFPGAGMHRELAQLVRAGLTPAEAIRAATLDAARFLAGGEEPGFGAVRAGLRADLLLVEGDPTEDVGALQEIREVFLEGVPLERRGLPRELRVAVYGLGSS